MTTSAVDRRIRSLRPPKPSADPYVAHGVLFEEERRPNGEIERTLTVFLTGAECPFTCSFCDLWRFTIDGPTPPGALTAQLANILETLDNPRPDRLKLYNASNFFDSRAVPPIDLAGIATMSGGFRAVTVESHANTVGRTAREFSQRISPVRLELAIGLETIHPVAAAQLNKRLDLAQFDSAAAFLTESDIDLRVFVLLGAPHVGVEESVDWTVRTVEYAIERGGSVVSIIPVRGGNGEMERLQDLGHFTPPTLSQLEDVFDRCSSFSGAAVTADLWDIERIALCNDCKSARVERLRLMNLRGGPQPRIPCDTCGAM